MSMFASKIKNNAEKHAKLVTELDKVKIEVEAYEQQLVVKGHAREEVLAETEELRRALRDREVILDQLARTDPVVYEMLNLMKKVAQCKEDCRRLRLVQEIQVTVREEQSMSNGSVST
jgi:hypothetical protein